MSSVKADGVSLLSWAPAQKRAIASDMTEPADKTSLEQPALGEAPAPAKRRSKARRFGCGLALLLWFTLLMTPCALFYLAATGEIRLEHGDIPQAHAHPLLLLSLISERDDRGLRIETSRIATGQPAGLTLCVETAVRFLLWQYSGGNQNVSYCDCYARQTPESAWELSNTSGDVCSPTR